MKNPWEEIELSDYESHMKLSSVMQLQAMNAMMKNQFNQYEIETVMILGVAGGNRLEHIDIQKIQKAYGVDINHKYLEKCVERYKNFLIARGNKYSYVIATHTDKGHCHNHMLRRVMRRAVR